MANAVVNEKPMKYLVTSCISLTLLCLSLKLLFYFNASYSGVLIKFAQGEKGWYNKNKPLYFFIFFRHTCICTVYTVYSLNNNVFEKVYHWGMYGNTDILYTVLLLSVYSVLLIINNTNGSLSISQKGNS